MRKMLLLAAALCSTAAIAKQWEGKATDDPVSARVEYVWVVSKTVCPTVAEAEGRGQSILDRAVDSYGLSTAEKLVLGNFCITYMEGHIDGLRKARTLLGS